MSITNMSLLLLHNSVTCLECGENLISRYNHDFKMCKCPNETFIDGGLGYGRYGGKDLTKVRKFIVTSEDEFSIQREYFERGSRGVSGKEDLKWVKLKDMSEEHIKAVISYSPDNTYNQIYERELKYRKSFEHCSQHIWKDTSHFVVEDIEKYENPFTGEIEEDVRGYTCYEKTCELCGSVIKY